MTFPTRAKFVIIGASIYGLRTVQRLALAAESRDFGLVPVTPRALVTTRKEMPRFPKRPHHDRLVPAHGNGALEFLLYLSQLNVREGSLIPIKSG